MTILVVDDLPIVREPIAAALRGVGHDTALAATGKEALAYLKDRTPDLVLLDLQLPDINGMKVLRTIRNIATTAKLPVILLTDEDTRGTILAAAGLGIQGYLLKSSFSMAELLARVERFASRGALTAGATTKRSPGTLSAMPVPQLLTRDECLSRLGASLGTKTLSGIVTQIISMAASPRASLTELAGLVSKDTLLAARVLQAANSAGYRSAKGAVTTIEDAIRLVGCSTIRNIAATIGIFEAMPETSPDGFNPIRCWQHSFAVAQLCETLAVASGLNSGEAYLVGLCHDLGEIILRTLFSAEYRQLVELEKSSGYSRDQLEIRMLGMAHSELIRAILQAFALPDAVRAPVEAFHSRAGHGNVPSIAGLDGVLEVADGYANGVLLASSPSSPVCPLTAELCKRLIGTATPPAIDMRSLHDQVLALTGLLARLSPREESELLKPLFARDDCRIWIAHEQSASSLDPISAAFESMSNARVERRLPNESELADIDGLVAVGGTEFLAKATANIKSGRPTKPLFGVPVNDSSDSAGDSADRRTTLAHLQSFLGSVISQSLAA